MLISEAMAQGVNMAAGAPEAPSPLWNFGLLAVMVVLFYVLLIRPQQKRFKEHSQLLDALQKGDLIVTGGGIVAQVEKILSDDELLVKISAEQSVTVRRATINGKLEESSASFKAVKAPAKKAAEKKAPAKKSTAKKASEKKSESKDKKDKA